MEQKKLNTLSKHLQNDDFDPDDIEQNMDLCDVDTPEDTDVDSDEDVDPVDGDTISDEPEQKPAKKKKTKEFYVDEKEFEDELKKYYETDVITVKLADMIRKMINGLAHRPNFINYTFRDEATGDALVNIMAALHKKKFKFGKSKPFSYFNAIAWNCWRNRIKREARQRAALASYQEEVYGEMVVAPKMERED